MSLVTPEVDTGEDEVVTTVAASKTKSIEVEETTMPEVTEAEVIETTAVPAVVSDETQITAVSEDDHGVVVVEEAKASAKRESGVQAYLNQQAEEGFEDLDVGAFSFDRIKLDDGQFLLGHDEVGLGEKFQFKVLATRAMFTVSQSDDQDSEMFYSYSADGSTKIDGQSSADTLAEWKEEGFVTEENPLVIKKYLEVMAELVDRDDEHSEAIVCLQVPPSSLQRFGGVAFMAGQRYKTNVGGVIVEASVGAKAGKGSKTFRPWNFKVLRKA